MADIQIALYDVQTGWLPAICPKHGQRADRASERKFGTKLPSWVVVFILLGILPFLIACAVMQKAQTFRFPSCADCQSGRQAARVIRWVVGLGSLGALGAGVGTASAGLVVLGSVLVLGWLFAMSTVLDVMSGPTGTLFENSIQVKKVHPAFIAAMRPNPALRYVAQQPTVSPPGWAPAPTGWGGSPAG
ncbi:MAG: hypothetical protein ABIM89_12380 [Mycobacteriales bacterium]